MMSSLMSEQNIYLFYGDAIIIYSVTNIRLHIKLSRHATSFTTRLLHRDVSLLLHSA